MTETVTEKLMARQVELEQQMRALGVARYRQRTANRVEAEAASETEPGTKLLRRAVEPTAKAIEEWIAEATTGKPGRRHSAVRYVKDMDPYILSFLTCRTVLDLVPRDPIVQVVCRRIARAVQDEQRFSHFEVEDPYFYRAVRDDLNDRSLNYNHVRAVLTSRMKKRGVSWEEWPEQDLFHVGAVLLGCMIEATGMVRKVLASEGVKARKNFLEFTPETAEWVEKAHEWCELLSPVYMPMVVPPSPTEGGYLSSTCKTP